jgi:hypothetical protein
MISGDLEQLLAQHGAEALFPGGRVPSLSMGKVGSLDLDVLRGAGSGAAAGGAERRGQVRGVGVGGAGVARVCVFRGGGGGGCGTCVCVRGGVGLCMWCVHISIENESPVCSCL